MQRTDGGGGGRDGPGGRTIMTLADVARAAGVHPSTVSRALDPLSSAQVNLETRQRVEALAKRMGYQKDMVASGLKRGRTHTVAVIAGDLGNPNLPPVLRGIANGLEQAGLMTLISETQFDSERLEWIVKHLMSRRVDVDGGALHPPAQKRLRDGQQQTGAIARTMVGGHRSAMTDTM